MRYARIYPWRRTRRSRAPSNGPEAFFVAQFSAGYTTNMFGFDLPQGQPPRHVYQHCSEKHLHRYLSEIDFRYSNRVALGVNDGERADLAIKASASKRLAYRQPH